MGKTLELPVGVGTKREVGKGIADVERHDVSIMGLDMLQATLDLEGLVIDIILVVLQLGAGMDGLATPRKSILMKDSHNRPMLSLTDSTTGDNGQVGQRMLVNASDIDCSAGLGNNADIRACESTISTTINQRLVG